MRDNLKKKMTTYDFNLKNFNGNNWRDGGKSVPITQTSDKTIDQLLSDGGLAYKVGLKETFYRNDHGEFVKTGEFATINLDSDKFIRGGFSANYAPRSFSDVFHQTLGKVYDDLLAQGFVAANVVSIDEGKGCITQMRLPIEVTIKDRVHKPYLNLPMGHNGKYGIAPSGGDVCAVCLNTTMMVLAESSLLKVVKHTENIDQSLGMLASNIRMILEGMPEHYQKMDRFASITVTETQKNEWLKALLPDTFLRDGKTINASRGNKRNTLAVDIQATLKESNDTELTIYDLLQGVSRFNTHTTNKDKDGKEKRTASEQFEYLVNTGANFYERAEQLAESLAQEIKPL